MSYVLNEKVMIVLLMVGLIKRHSMNFEEPKFLGGRVKVELDLSKYKNKSTFKKCNSGWYIIFC